jgi:hypothetical protein
MEAGIYRERLKKVAAQDAEQQRIHAQEKKNAACREEPVPTPLRIWPATKRPSNVPSTARSGS